ncbi:MAG: hypothetical protein K2N52_04995, partial [Clostridia bacterium]|nr:hypothetical protein [Clostridia bacterium]
HAQAAGVNVTLENFGKLEAALNEYITAKYKPEEFLPTIYINGKLENPFSPRFARELEMLEPFGVGNRRPMFEISEASSEVRPIKPQSPHLCVKSDKIELMYFGGGKYFRLLSSSAPRKYIFEYNISVFRGREYVKGFIRDVICEKSAGKYAEEEIAVNNIITLAWPKCNCKIINATAAEIESGIESGCGTLYIASEYNTLERYKSLKNLPVELFTLGTSNLADTVIISPQFNIDASGFKKVVFLESLVSGVRIPSLENKEVVICSDIKGNNFIKNLPCKREELLKIFAYVSANAANLEGGDSYEVALNNKFSFKPSHVAFALEVFRQLNLISYDGGRLNLFKGVKTELTNSELYNIVCNLNG